MAKEIIINRMFSGNYLDNEENIGHEIINMYKDDEGHNYIYLLSGGDYQEAHAEIDVTGILLVRGITANCVEVLAKATGIKKVFNPTKPEIIKSDEKRKKHWKNGWTGTNTKEMRTMGQEFQKLLKQYGTDEELYDALDKSTENISFKHKIMRFRDVNKDQCAYIENNNITYDEVSLNKLFSKNNTEYGLSIYITYKANNVQKVKQPFYLYLDKEGKNFSRMTDNDRELHRGRLSGSAMATFYPDGTDDYNTLHELLFEHDELWGEETVRYKDVKKPDDNFTFLSLIHKEYDELAFSNMLAYYLKKYPQLLNDILRLECVREKYQIHSTFQATVETKHEVKFDSTLQEEDSKNNCNNNNRRIAREEKNIDLLIDDFQNSTVIVIENKIKSGLNGRHSTESIKNQLDKYYEYTEKQYHTYQHRIYLLLIPNYSDIKREKLVTNAQQAYDVICYKDLLGVLKKYTTKIQDKYYKDFVNAVSFHCTDIDNHFQEIMLRKMTEMIANAKDSDEI